MPYPKKTPAEKLAARSVLRDTGCIEWVGMMHKYGYGIIAVEGRRTKLAHRVSYELAHGPIAPGLQIHHRCHNPACVNPQHLQAVTHAEHKAIHRSERTTCGHGHAWTTENTYLDRHGNRACRECRRERDRAATTPGFNRGKEAA